MEPIVSPWIFYAIEILRHMQMLLSFVMMFSFFAVFFTYASEENKKQFRVACCVAIISTTLLVFIPSENTVLNMLVAQYVTPDNIQMTQENIVEFIQQISEAIKK